MPRLIFVNRFFRPDTPATAQLLTDLVERLARTRDQVEVLTSRPHALPRVTVEAGVTIHRLRSLRLGNSGSLVTHFLDLLSYTVGALWWILLRTKKDDTVVFLTDPPLFAVLAQPLARLKRARVIHWIQDIYPEAIHRVSGRSWAQCLAPLRDASWRSADACVTLGTDMEALLIRAGVGAARRIIIPNWAPDGVQPIAKSQATDLREAWQLQDKFVLLYFGNLGRVHDLDLMLELARHLQHEPDICFCIVGPGPQKASMQAAAERSGLTNMRFFPAQPRERRSEVLAVGDLHVITLREGCEDVVYPSKLYGICAAAGPVLFLGPTHSEIARFIRDTPVGFVGDRNTLADMAQTVASLAKSPTALETLSHNAREFYETVANADVAAQRWTDLLNDLPRPKPLA